MKLGLFGLAAASILGFGASTASAQQVLPPVPYAGPTYVQPGYPGYSQPVVVAPTVVAPTVVGPAVGVGIYTPGISVGVGLPIYRGYYGPYYGGYRGPIYHHGRR